MPPATKRLKLAPGLSAKWLRVAPDPHRVSDAQSFVHVARTAAPFLLVEDGDADRISAGLDDGVLTGDAVREGDVYVRPGIRVSRARAGVQIQLDDFIRDQ